MKTIKIVAITLILAFVSSQKAESQTYNFSDFVGTWNGNIISTDWGYNYPTTIEIYSDGFYTESSGVLMPTIYPNTQVCDYDYSTNRLHFRYLKTVYSGMNFYENFYYEIVKLSNDTLEMHYNFWDDPVPHPEIETILVTKSTTTVIEEEISATNNPRKLIRVIDFTGRELPHDTKGQLLIHQYNDGTIEKKFIVD